MKQFALITTAIALLAFTSCNKPTKAQADAIDDNPSAQPIQPQAVVAPTTQPVTAPPAAELARARTGAADPVEVFDLEVATYKPDFCVSALIRLNQPFAIQGSTGKDVVTGSIGKDGTLVSVWGELSPAKAGKYPLSVAIFAQQAHAMSQSPYHELQLELGKTDYSLSFIGASTSVVVTLRHHQAK